MTRISARRGTRDGVSIIADGVTVRGDISSNTDIEVHGEVIGDSNINASVVIADGGVWRGKLTARDVTVAGKVVGAVRASGQIEIVASARIEGTVTGSAIAVQQGRHRRRRIEDTYRTAAARSAMSPSHLLRLPPADARPADAAQGSSVMASSRISIR